MGGEGKHSVPAYRLHRDGDDGGSGSGGGNSGLRNEGPVRPRSADGMGKEELEPEAGAAGSGGLVENEQAAISREGKVDEDKLHLPPANEDMNRNIADDDDDDDDDDDREGEEDEESDYEEFAQRVASSMYEAISNEQPDDDDEVGQFSDLSEGEIMPRRESDTAMDQVTAAMSNTIAAMEEMWSSGLYVVRQAGEGGGGGGGRGGGGRGGGGRGGGGVRREMCNGDVRDDRVARSPSGEQQMAADSNGYSSAFQAEVAGVISELGQVYLDGVPINGSELLHGHIMGDLSANGRDNGVTNGVVVRQTEGETEVVDTWGTQDDEEEEERKSEQQEVAVEAAVAEDIRRRAEPIPLARRAAIMDAMRNVNLGGFVPDWAQAMPESEWTGMLRSRMEAPTPTTSSSSQDNGTVHLNSSSVSVEHIRSSLPV